MKRWLPAVLALILTLALLNACGSTPTATAPAPSATAQAIVVTELVTLPLQPTQTPWIIVATPTPVPTASVSRTRAAVTPTVDVTENPMAKPGATTTTTPGTTATQAPARPAPTLTPRPSATPKYSAPILSEPPYGVSISWSYKALLIWQPVGDLAEDEYYCVRLDAYRESDQSPWYGDYVFTKDSSFLAGDAFLAPFHPPESQGRANVYWWVSVVRKTGEDQAGKPVGVEISPPSDKWLFVAEPKPE